MAKSGPEQQSGLRWHKKGGWYRRYDGKPLYFGGGGSVETSEQRKADREVKEVAHRAYIKYESDHHFKDTIKTVDRAAGRMTGFAAAAHLIAENIDVENSTPEQLKAWADRLKNASAQYAQQVSGGVQQLATEALPPPPVNEGPTCQMVVDVYLKYLLKNASNDHYLDAKMRLSKWKQPAKGKRKRPTIPYWLDWVDPKLPIRSLTREHFKGYRDHINSLVKAGKAAQSTANKSLVLVKGAFTSAYQEQGYTSHDLPTLVKLLKTKKTESTDRDIFTTDHLTKMLEDFDVKWKGITLMALNCALRNVDIAFLEWDDIKWDDQYLNLTRSKQKGKRRTPLWDRTMDALKLLRKKSKPNKLIFPNEDGNPFIKYAYGRDGKSETVTSKNDNLSRGFRRRMRRLTMPYSFAIFAKSSATVAKPFVDGETIEMLLGDAADKVWKKHYVMTYPANVAKAAKAIEEHYFG